MKNKKLSQIDKAYNDKLKLLNKKVPQGSSLGLAVFVEQLRHQRDTLIVQSTLESSKENDAKTASLMIAVAEFETYQKSEDVSQKKFHWNNFWEFVKLNMEEWLMLNDTI
jgi:hypothetical protein